MYAPSPNAMTPEKLKYIRDALEGSIGALEFNLDFHREDGSNFDIAYISNKLDAVKNAINIIEENISC
jgi:hypothetical protein